MYISANIFCHTGLTYQGWAISFSIFPLAFGNHSFILILILKKFLLHTSSPLYLSAVVGATVPLPSGFSTGAIFNHEIILVWGSISLHSGCSRMAGNPLQCLTVGSTWEAWCLLELQNAYSIFLIAWSIVHNLRCSLVHSLVRSLNK